jgi:hypothetical protein
VIADILWVFPGKTEERVEAMFIGDLMDWHARAVSRKQADWNAMQAAMLGALAALRR